MPEIKLKVTKTLKKAFFQRGNAGPKVSRVLAQHSCGE